MLSEQNHALVERLFPDHVPAQISDAGDLLDRLLDAAREEGKMNATVLPKIRVAELCFSLGWGAGYSSALAGSDGPCMPEEWANSPARLLTDDDL